MQRWLQEITQNKQFVFNLSQFDEFMELFKFYKTLSSELNNNASYKVVSISQPYYFVPIDVKEIETDDNDRIINLNGIVTSGMYADPYVVFREYIQNSVDSVDEAVRVGVLLRGAEQIVVKLVPTEQQIVISDNGLGIPSAEAEKTLISIGNSQKSSENSRGFRGIGRLSALSYCIILIKRSNLQKQLASFCTIIHARTRAWRTRASATNGTLRLK